MAKTIEWTEPQDRETWLPKGPPTRERELEGALRSLMGFVGQLTPPELCDAIFRHNPHLDMNEKRLIEMNLECAIGWAWHSLSLEPHK